jgi:starvation-inducible DNA-binding protein
MTSSITDILQAAVEAPKKEMITQEVIIQKDNCVDNLIYNMVALASYLYQLNTQAHLLHLNIESPQFLALHKFLQKQYEQHTTDFDTVSELVRSMDYLMPMCQNGLLSAYKKFPNTKTYEANDSLVTYLKNLEQGGMLGKAVVEMAKEVEAPDVENFVAEIVNNMFKSAWMLKATLRNS